MVTDAAQASSGPVESAPPYSPSWVDDLLALLDRTPGGAWVGYAVLLVPSVVIASAPDWLAGVAPIGRFAPAQTLWGVIVVGVLGAMRYLDRVAATAFETFRPQLDASPAEASRLRYELLNLPARATLVVTFIALPLTLAYYAADPVDSEIAGLSPVAVAGRAIWESVAAGIFLVFLYHALRQLRSVSRIHARTQAIDLFRTGPLFAFSRLTARTGIALILLVTAAYAASAQTFDSGTAFALWLPWLVGLPALAIAAFVVPLEGSHRKIVAEKDRLRDGSESRVKGVLDEISRDVDDGDLSHLSALGPALGVLIQQRDIISKLPTWPWSPSTARGLVSAVTIPLLLFILQRLLTPLL